MKDLGLDFFSREDFITSVEVHWKFFFYYKSELDFGHARFFPMESVHLFNRFVHV